MSQILFGQSYYLRFDPKLYAAMQPYPPLGTLYAASYLRQRGYDVALFDAMLAESEDEWAAALDRHRPQFAVLYEDNFNYLSKMCLLRMREAAFKMIDMAKAQDCTVVLCGADVTDHADLYFEHGVDFALIGEGEETLGELLDALTQQPERRVEPGSEHSRRVEEINLQSNDALENILGLVTPTTQHVTRRPDITHLDELPFPAWDLVDIPRYQKIWRERHGCYSMNMVTTRGCPYHCNWCAKPIWGQRYNSRSPENVAAEMKWLKETYQPDHIWFADDIFGLKPGWIEKFGALVKEHDAAIPFKCLLRADLVKPSVVEGLKRAGCQWVWMGAESGSQKILDAMDKGTTVQQIYEARRLLGEAGINVAFFLQFGYPGETRTEVERTLQMVRETLPDDIGISVSYPLPGTKFYERVKSQLGEKQNWRDSDDLAMLFQGPFPQKFYRVLHRTVHAEFRMRRAWLKIKRGSLSMRALASVPYHWLGWKMNRWRLNRIEQSSSPTPTLSLSVK
jgi:anaerobic magnesium-protoporphyrin IX monomethyl ester cyclase